MGHVCKVINCYFKKGFIFYAFSIFHKTHIHEHKTEWDMTTVMANKAAEAEYHNDAKENDSDGDI